MLRSGLYLRFSNWGKRIQVWLAPPIFPADDNKTRRASLLNLVLLGFIAFSFLLFLRDAEEGTTPLSVLFTNASTTLIILALWITMRLGKVNLAGVGLLTLGLITITAILAGLGTIRTPTTAIYLSVIVTAGLLFDLIGILICGLACSLLVFGLIGAENAGWLATPDYTNSLTQWFTYTIIFVLTGGLSYIGSRSTQIALARAKHEIAERKQAEQSLHQNQTNLRVLLDTISESVLLLETDGTVVVANPTVARRMHTTTQELIGRCVYDFLPSPLAEQRRQRLDEIIRTGQPTKFEDTRKGHTYFTSAAPVLDEQGHVTRLALFGFDLTERKQAEELYGALVAASPDGITLFDPQGRLQFASPRALEMFGHDPTDDVAGKSLLDWFPPHEHAHVMKNWNLVLHAQSFNDSQYELCRKDGSRFFGEIITNRLYDTAGNIKNIIAMTRDISERKRVNDALRASNQHLELLAQAGRELSTTLDLPVIYATLAQIIRRAMPSDFIFVSNFEASEQLIRCVYALSPQEELDATTFPPIPLEEQGRGTQSRVIRSGTPLLLNDYVAQLKTAATNYYVDEDGTFESKPAQDDVEDSPQSALIVPLKLDGKVKGVIQAMSNERNAYAPGDLQFLESLALYAANAMAHANLFAQVQKELVERKHAEEELQHWFDFIPECVAIAAPDGYFKKVNREWEHILGYTAAEILSRPFVDFIHPDDRATTNFHAINEQVAKYTNAYFENRYRAKDGTYHWFAWHVVPALDGRMLIAAARDITEQKHAQQALENLNQTLEQRVQERSAQVQDLYDNAPCGYHSLDENGVFTRINQTELDWLGYTRQEILGVKSFRDLVDVETQPTFAENFALLKTRGWVKDLVYEMIRKDGTRIPVLLNATAIYDAHGKYIMSRSTIVDITEQRKVESALRESEAYLRASRDELSAANVALAKAARLKDEFLASMSHELRTPLTGILGLSEVLQTGIYGELSEKQNSTLRTIEESGRHLLNLINDILDLSKIEAGKLDLQPEIFSVDDICQASLRMIKQIAASKRQRVSFSMRPAEMIITADPRRLKQILVNLLSNAVKFTPENGELGLQVETDSAQHQVRFIVWDKGIGISQDDQAKLFQPFVQLDSRLSRSYSGTGLGLALVQRLTEMHHGTVELESALGQGSRITITLPWQPTLTPEQPALSIPAYLANTIASVLILDDSPIASAQLKHHLSELGIYRVTIRSQIAGTLDYIRQARPSVVLLDVMLPDGSGWELLRQLRADAECSTLPVIIITVLDDRDRAMALGATEYVLKPVALFDLHHALIQVMQKITTHTNRAGDHAAPSKAQPTILLAEDSEVNVQVVSSYLTHHGFTVVVASDGKQTLEKLTELRPAIILMDIQMPLIDGLEATRRIRALSDPTLAQTPIIALTALAMPGDRERCLAAGANAYMSKPIQLAELNQLIQRYLKL